MDLLEQLRSSPTSSDTGTFLFYYFVNIDIGFRIDTFAGIAIPILHRLFSYRNNYKNEVEILSAGKKCTDTKYGCQKNQVRTSSGTNILGVCVDSVLFITSRHHRPTQILKEHKTCSSCKCFF